MPQAIQYTAKRELVNTLDSLVSMNLHLTRKDRSREANRREVIALSGRRVTTYYSGKRVWNVRTKPYSGSDVDQLREFIASVEDGQQFSFAPDNFIGDSPITWVGVYLFNRPAPVRRAASLGGDQSADYFSFSWSMIEA